MSSPTSRGACQMVHNRLDISMYVSFQSIITILWLFCHALCGFDSRFTLWFILIVNLAMRVFYWVLQPQRYKMFHYLPIPYIF